MDWRQGFRRCAEEPAAVYEYVRRLVLKVGCDGLRMFVQPDPMYQGHTDATRMFISFSH